MAEKWYMFTGTGASWKNYAVTPTFLAPSVCSKNVSCNETYVGGSKATEEMQYSRRVGLDSCREDENIQLGQGRCFGDRHTEFEAKWVYVCTAMRSEIIVMMYGHPTQW